MVPANNEHPAPSNTTTAQSEGMPAPKLCQHCVRWPGARPPAAGGNSRQQQWAASPDSCRDMVVQVSYLEIYNEALYDLLSDTPASSDSLAVLEDGNSTYVSAPSAPAPLSHPLPVPCTRHLILALCSFVLSHPVTSCSLSRNSVSHA
jgi:hypothetical protein